MEIPNILSFIDCLPHLATLHSCLPRSRVYVPLCQDLYLFVEDYFVMHDDTVISTLKTVDL